ncbi:hypothetical protein [Plesiomonas shigelloides]|uniref:hypothetical protein n=1 Tax=Plesiomonas shigelloides TaxID=703 RepID=UPI0031B74A18
MVFVNHILVKDSFCYISADFSVSVNKKGTPQRAFFLFELSSIFPYLPSGFFTKDFALSAFLTGNVHPRKSRETSKQRLLFNPDQAGLTTGF